MDTYSCEDAVCQTGGLHDQVRLQSTLGEWQVGTGWRIQREGMWQLHRGWGKGVVEGGGVDMTKFGGDLERMSTLIMFMESTGNNAHPHFRWNSCCVALGDREWGC